MDELAKLIATVEEHTVDDHIGRHGWGVVAKKLLKYLLYYIELWHDAEDAIDRQRKLLRDAPVADEYISASDLDDWFREYDTWKARVAKELGR